MLDLINLVTEQLDEIRCDWIESGPLVFQLLWVPFDELFAILIWGCFVYLRSQLWNIQNYCLLIIEIISTAPYLSFPICAVLKSEIFTLWFRLLYIKSSWLHSHCSSSIKASLALESVKLYFSTRYTNEHVQ